MRGKAGRSFAVCCSAGITPAYAGKRGFLVSIISIFRDHPRVCGEKLYDLTALVTDKGSPPRMRGKEPLSACAACPCRITPAYAGKSETPFQEHTAGWDHPRVCGEKFSGKTSNTFHPGSPPRMRGKGHDRQPRGRAAGITPAYAGKSITIERFNNSTRDHPRVCGEKFALWLGVL